MRPNEQAPEPKMDVADLYREDVFTDRRVGSIRRLSPVTADGTADARRPTLFVGQAQLLTQLGALPLSFEIDAGSLDEAVAKFADAAKVAVERTMKELQEMRREAASSIVVPERGMGPGGISGGGKIQFP